MKNKIFLIVLLFLTNIVSATSIFVESFDEQGNNSGQVTLRLRITNNSPNTLNDVRVRYFLNYERDRTLVLSPYYLAGATVSIDTLGDYLAVNIDISAVAPGVFPNTSGISLGMNYTDYNNFNKQNNFSYPGTTGFEVVSNIPIYLNGTILVGSTPIGDEIPKIRFVGVQPENSDTRSAWVELENYGSTDINLANYFLKWTTIDSVSIGNVVLPSGSKIRICQSNDSLECPSADVVAIKNFLPFDSVGELAVNNAGFPIDYIAWGSIGSMSDSIRMINEYLETKRFFDTEKVDYAGPVVSYTAGSFYHAVISKDDFSIVRWNLFPANQINANASSMPSAEPLSLSDGSIVYLAPNEKMTFAWIPVDGAKSYDLIIVNASDSSLVYEKITSKTSEKVLLPYGEYLWGVASLGEEDVAGWSLIDVLFPGIGIIENVIDYLISSDSSPDVAWVDLLLKESTVGVPIYDLGAVPQAARKDSYMLDLKWGQYILQNPWADGSEYISWDSPRNTSSTVESWGLSFSDNKEELRNREEAWRCWAVAVSILNHYNGGNITQDEIKFHIFGNKDPILGAFPQGEEGGVHPDDESKALRWALGLNQASLHYGTGRPSIADILEQLENNRPVIIWQKKHIMVVDAVRKHSDEDGFELRFLNTDNNGLSEWKVYKNEKDIKRYWFPELTTSPKMSDLYIDLNGDKKMERGVDNILDADGDGILDFDEEYRFNTLKNSDDSDGDYIKDKIEIMSYTLREPYHEGGVTKEVYSDIDGDGSRAESDEDSDNGGRKDGEEDANHDGIKDLGETDPYKAFDDFNSTNPVILGEFALYAISNLKVNDGVICHNESGYCDIASASVNSTDFFSLIVGARASVGNVYSRGNVFFRSHSHIFGNVNLGQNASLDDISMQNGSVFDGNIVQISDEEWFSNYPIIGSLMDYDLSDAQSRVIWNSISLQDGAVFASLVATNNSVIYIYPGEMWIGNLQINPGAKIVFVNPGQQTILHVNGSVVWRGAIQNQASSYNTIAKGFKFVQHSSKRMYIDEVFLGTIVAPASHVIIGQSRSPFYGSIMADKISVHQYTEFYYVKFNPTTTLLTLNF